jgi:glycosyltransferase involved in cell wall biosynthesis
LGGGAGVVASQYVDGLRNRGHTVDLIHKRKVLNGYFGKTWLLIMFLKILLSCFRRYDYIIVNDIGASILTFPIYYTFGRLKRVVYFVHGGERFWYMRQQGFLSQFYKYSLNRVFSIIAVSNYIKNEFSEVIGIPNSAISVIYAGIDFSQVPIRPSESYDKRKEHTLKLLTVGRLVPSKGIDASIRVLSKLVESGIDAELKVVGSGPEMLNLQNQAKSAGVANRVVFSGQLAKADVYLEYYSSDVLLLLSHHEAFGLVYLESQFCGCAPIGLDVEGVVEAIDDGISGFLVSNENEAYELLRKPNLFQIDNELMRRRAENFSVEAAISEFLGVLNVH